MRRGIAKLWVCVSIIAVGCTAAGSGDDAGAAAMAARSGSFGLVRIDRNTELEAELSGPGAVLSGAFAQYRGVGGRDVLALLGGRAAEVETCRLSGADVAAFASPDAQVVLVDVGDLEVRVAGTRTQMLSRTFPDLAGIVGGVFYAEDVTLGAARADVDEYVVSAGGGELPGFEVVAVAPPGFSEVTLDGVAIEEAALLDRRVEVVLEWDAGDPRDRVEIDLASGGQAIECVARDDGAFRVDAQTLGWLDADENAQLIVRRVRTQPFDATGLDTAWVEVASSRAHHLTVR